MDWTLALDWLLDELSRGLSVIVGLPIAGAILWVVFRAAIRLAHQAAAFMRSRNRALNAVARTISAEGRSEGPGVWLTRPIDQPDNYQLRLQRPPVLAIANLKGGVGKTTLTANLGAYFAKDYEVPLNVLLIDLDFQGSLSSMAFPQDQTWIPAENESSTATQLISDDIEPNEIRGRALRVDLKGNTAGSLSVITAHYDLAQADNRILVEWLLGPRVRVPKSRLHALAELLVGKLYRTDDVRYTLAEMLHSKAVTGSKQKPGFDLVIVDCPPRLTTSEVQAFCASTHLLIPTIFDRPSAEAVASLCNQIEILKRENICPHLEYIGVVATKWKPRAKAAPAAIQDVQDALQNRTPPLEVPILPEPAFVPDTTALVNDAGEGIAYLVMPQRAKEVRDAIGQLAEHISRAMRLPRRAAVYTPQPAAPRPTQPVATAAQPLAN